jgi:hypothetical protein
MRYEFHLSRVSPALSLSVIGDKQGSTNPTLRLRWQPQTGFLFDYRAVNLPVDDSGDGAGSG